MSPRPRFVNVEDGSRVYEFDEQDRCWVERPDKLPELNAFISLYEAQELVRQGTWRELSWPKTPAVDPDRPETPTGLVW